MADFSSSAFGGTGPDPAISPSIGGIAKNLTSTLFGNPDDYARNQYYGAETRNKDQETTNLQDAATAAKGLADTFSNPDFFSKPPPGVDPGQWVAQHLSSAASNAFLSAYAKDPAAAMGNVNKLAGMVNIMTGNQAQGLTGLALEGHAPDENTALTPDAQATIYGRKAQTELSKAGIAANAEIAANKYRTDNSAVTASPGGTVFVGPNSGLRTPENAGVLHGADTPDTVEGAQLAKQSADTQIAPLFKPHNISQDSTAIVSPGTPGAPQGGLIAGPTSLEGQKARYLGENPGLTLPLLFQPHNAAPGDVTNAAPTDPRFGPGSTQQVAAPRPVPGKKAPLLSGPTETAINANVAARINPTADNPTTAVAQMLSVLSPADQQAYSQAVADDFAQTNSVEHAAGVGQAFLQSKIDVAHNPLTWMDWSNPYSARSPVATPRPAAPTQQSVGGAGETRVDSQGVIWQRGADGKVHAIGKQG